MINFSHFNIVFSKKKTDIESVKKELAKKYSENQIVFDLLTEDQTNTENIRNFLSKNYLKNSTGEIRLLVIEAFDLNNFAQNSLLKFAEEPPKNTFLFLLVQEGAFLLPTIYSRGVVFRDIFDYEDQSQSKTNKNDWQIPQVFLSLNHSERLEKIATIKEDVSLEKKKSLKKFIFNLINYSKKNNIKLPDNFLLDLPLYTKQLNFSGASIKVIFEDIAVSLPILKNKN